MKLRLLLPLALLLAAIPALAHDMWLVPPTKATAGQPVEVVVSVGMDFPASLEAIDPARMRISALGPQGAKAEVTLHRDEEAGHTLARFTPTRDGVWTLETETKPKVLAMTAAKFNDYLLHDGLPHVLAGRMDRGETDQDAVELYSKFVQTVIPVGNVTESRKGLLGHTLEIELLDDPLQAKVGSTIRARVYFKRELLERANLCWDIPGNGEDFGGQTWTNAKGEALIPVSQTGPMTIRLVHMTRPQLPEYEWESFWASTTFHIGG